VAWTTSAPDQIKSSRLRLNATAAMAAAETRLAMMMVTIKVGMLRVIGLLLQSRRHKHMP
jgi:hypothetical protein